MVGKFDVHLGDKVTGDVHVERQGLYYYFRCRCTLPGKGMYRLTVSSDGKREDLGGCVPMEGRFGVEKKIPCKRLGEGTPEFRLVVKGESGVSPGKFIPVYPEEPFAYIRKLENAFLVHRDGQVGIMIQEKDG